MARGEEPLFRSSTDMSSSRSDIAEEDALLTGEATSRSAPFSRWKRWREIGLFAWALLATVAVVFLGVVYEKQIHRTSASPHPTGKRNLIFMVSDGMGPTSLSLTRSYKQYALGLPYNDQLVLDTHLIGQSRTRSSNSLVTDSAAGATAFSCGLKSYNGAISVLDDHSPCGTVLEAAKKAGYMTGLVVTTRITDATPACFAAHVNMRSEEDRIAEQLIGKGPLGHVVDLMLGGGRSNFLPNTTDGSTRMDDKDVIALAKNAGYAYIDDRKGFDGLKLGSTVNLPLLGLFSNRDIPYEVDRRYEEDIYPSLDEMAVTAMNALSAATKNSDKGFFLMIEGSRIDHAGHTNDPVAQVHEVLAYDKAFASVLDFLEKDTVQGVMVSTSDHETGGLAVARQLHQAYPAYLWHPSVLANASHSAERLARNYHEFLDDEAAQDAKNYILKTLSSGLGIHDPSEDEVNNLVDSPDGALYAFSDMISRRAQTGWSTHGHSGADVNIYASSPDAAEPLQGNHENTEVGKFLREYLDVDVEAITKELKVKSKQFDQLDSQGMWMGRVPEHDERLDGQDHMEHYAGDHKRKGRRKDKREPCNH